MSLVHDVFHRPSEIITSMREACKARCVELERFRWITPQEPLSFTDDPEVAVVLDLTLDTLQRTFEFGVGYASASQAGPWRCESMVSTPDRLALIDGCYFRSWTIGWRRVKLNAFPEAKVKDVRSPAESPGCAILFMAGQHPERIRQIDNKRRMGIFLPGLASTGSDTTIFKHVPLIDYLQSDQHIMFGTYDIDEPSHGLAVPKYLN